VRRNAPSGEFRSSLERVAAEIDADRATLIGLMEELRAETNQVELASGYMLERLGRLKLNGRRFRSSPSPGSSSSRTSRRASRASLHSGPACGS
jgi:hypothetical protein